MMQDQDFFSNSDNFSGSDNAPRGRADEEARLLWESALDDEPDEAGGEQPIRPAMAVGALIERLLHDAQTPEPTDFHAFSDLSRQDYESLREQWPLIAADRRREVVGRLVESAREDVFLHLERLLRVAMGDSEADIRQAAIEGLGEEASADLIGSLVQILHNDPEGLVRAAAAAALGAYVLAGELDEMDSSLTMRAEEALLNVLQNEAEPLAVQCAALESLAYSGEIGVRQLIEDAYYSPYEEMRVSSLIAMGRSADVRWRGRGRAELQNPSPEMRAGAAIACGELEAKAAVDDLIELLNDDEELVRVAAIFALGRIGERSAREALQAIAAGEFEVEAAAAEEALEEMLFYRDVEGIPLYDEAEEEDEDEDSEPWDAWYDRDDLDLGSYE